MNTKNISLLGLGLFAAVALASCDNIEESLSKPITNPQLPIFESSTVVYTPESAINASDPAAGEVKVASCSATDLPEGFTIGGILQLSKDADFSTFIESLLVNKDNDLYADLSTLAAQYTATYTKFPETVSLYGRTILTASNAAGTESVRLGSTETYYGVQSYTFTPAAPAEIIAPAYYVVMGDGTNWDFAGAYKMNHNGANQYDDPNFSVVIKEASTTGDMWIIMSEDAHKSAKADGSLTGVEYLAPVYYKTDAGVNYGELVMNGSLNNLPTVTIPCEVAINMEKKTYTTKAAVEHYYVTGDGWANWGSAHWMPLFTTNFADYYGFLNLGNQFKFSPQAGWGGDFGAANAPTESEDNGVFSYSGVCHDSGDNIVIGQSGLYFAFLNGVTWDYNLQQIKSWGLIGDFNSWGGDIEMTPSEDLYIWTAELTVADGQGWKFRANAAWAINLGGQPDALWSNGDNITLPAGTYTITLDLTTYPATFTAVKK